MTVKELGIVCSHAEDTDQFPRPIATKPCHKASGLLFCHFKMLMEKNGELEFLGS